METKFIESIRVNFYREEPFLPIEKIGWENIKKWASNISIGLTNKCNMLCNICCDRDSTGNFFFEDMDKETVKIILEKIGKNKKVFLSGGEPTVRDDLFDIIELISSSGNMPMIYTNGLKLADGRYIKKLSASGIKKVYFSLDGVDVNTTVQLRRDSIYHYLKLKALKNLKKDGKIKVWLSSTIAKNINEKEVKNLLNFAIEHNSFIKGIIFIAFSPVGWWQLPEGSELHPSDLMNLVMDASDGVVNHRYCLQFNHLRYAIFSFLKRFGRYFPLYENSVYLNIKNKQLTQIFSLEDLGKINKALENRRYLSLVRYAFNPQLWPFILQILYRPTFIEKFVYKRSGLHVMIDYLKPPPQEGVRLLGHTIKLIKRNNKIYCSQITY